MRILFAIACCALPAALHAQSVDLRLEAGGRTSRVPGVSAHGTTYYPIWALDRLGASTVADARGAQTSLFGDTLIFDALSPWFRTRRAVEHLAFPVIRHGGVVHLPEQFFIEWLPAHHEARVDYRGGVLRARRAAGAIAASVTRTPEDTRVVIIDPGHGGRDPGRIGPDGLREKDVALAISQRLARALRERGYEVHLTRATDTLVALDDRPRLANEWRDGRPAVFVSLHANAADADAVRGFETFFLSEARTEDEQRVAEMENAAIEFEDGDGAVSDLDVILNGLRNDFWVRASSDLAEIVQSGLASAHDGPDRGVKRAGFRVLVGALMPAVLVEVAFLSNRADAQMLASEAFRDRSARGIADAIHGFFESHHYLSAGTR